MKIILPCFECSKTDGKAFMVLGNVRDDMIVPIRCPANHEFVATLQHARFEVLFQSASLALLDGYPREAVASFTAALERFFEYYIRVSLMHAGLQAAQTDAAWRLVARQSERQLGAFVYLYLRDTGRAFSLPAEIPEFRNRVLHQGYIPTEQEVRDYAQRVLAVIETVFDYIRDNWIAHVDRIMMDDVAERNRTVPAGVQRMSGGGMTVLNVTFNRNKDHRTLDQRLLDFSELWTSLHASLAPPRS